MKAHSKIDSELKKFISQRSEIWQKYDEAIGQKAELDKFRRFDNPHSTVALSPMSNSKTPPDEVAVVVWKLKEEANKIKDKEQLIQSYQRKIEETKNQFMSIVAVGILIVGILLYYIFN
ncbi:MAG: hypothetical protein AAFV71_25900 [Cyanobacteria bacterium J06633_8]